MRKAEDRIEGFMKRKKLNKRGKILFTSLTIMLSVVIYVLMVVLGEKAQDSIFYQVVALCGWGWLIIGQIMAYCMIWGNEVIIYE